MSASALLVIDTQQAAFNGVFCPPIDRAENLVTNARALIDAARDIGTPIIFIQHSEGKGEPFEEGTSHWEFHEQLTPHAGEPVVKKYVSSAFEKTDLDAKLAALGVRDLIICGLQSDFCVSNTSKSALALGYRVHIASDAHSTWPSNGQTPAAIVRDVNNDLQSRGAVLESTAEIAGKLRARWS
ncbi:MAG: cysteine hydrolase [Burkholderiales bacterium]|nr:cysteine hydrolase [Burkholderiales bacterium]